MSYQAIVIGAGLGGSLSAYFLGQAGYKVALLEAGNSILPDISTSCNQSYCLHTGLHFIKDKCTAEQTTEETINFKRYFPSEVFFSAPASYEGRAFIFEGTVEEKTVKETVQAVNAYYRQRVLDDPQNAVLVSGEEDLIKMYSIEEFRQKYQSHVPDEMQVLAQDGTLQTRKVKYVLQSFEPKVNIDQLRQWLSAQIEQNSNITFFPNSKVTALAAKENNEGRQYEIITESGQVFSSEMVVNAAWTNSQKINYLYSPEAECHVSEGQKTIVRVKHSLEVTLPKELRDEHSFIIGYGPYGSFVNFGDGRAKIIYEYVNDWHTDLNPQSEASIRQHYGNLDLSTEEGNAYAKKILVGVSQFLPGLEKSDINKLCRGEVIHEAPIEKNFSVHDLNGAHNGRLEKGVGAALDTNKMPIPGLLVNQARKMTYVVGNAEWIRNEANKFFSCKKAPAILPLPSEEMVSKTHFRTAEEKGSFWSQPNRQLLNSPTEENHLKKIESEIMLSHVHLANKPPSKNASAYGN